MIESQNPALRQEAEGLADFYRRQGQAQKAEALLARLPSGPPPPATAEIHPEPMAPPPPEIQFEEFDIEPAPPPAAEPPPSDEFGSDAIRFSAGDVPLSSVGHETTAPAEPHRATPLDGIAPMESDFVSYEELGSLLDDEMQKAGEAPAPPPPAAQPAGVVDDQSLFADEQQFFNLAEELERELSDEAQPLPAPAMAGPEGEASLEEIFREFKKGVEQQLSAEDYETHFNLGIAYKEMGIDEAMASPSGKALRVVECYSMLGPGRRDARSEVVQEGTETPIIKRTDRRSALRSGCVYQSIETPTSVPHVPRSLRPNTNYRDVVSREGDRSGRGEWWWASDEDPFLRHSSLVIRHSLTHPISAFFVRG
jgi:hypothetical protein